MACKAEDKSEAGSLPCSRKSSRKSKRPQLHRNILSADFDALFEWAKEREIEHPSEPYFTVVDTDKNSSSRVPYNSSASLDPSCSSSYLAPPHSEKGGSVGNGNGNETRRSQSHHSLTTSHKSSRAHSRESVNESTKSGSSGEPRVHEPRDRVHSMPSSDSPMHLAKAAAAITKAKTNAGPSITHDRQPMPKAGRR